MKEHLAITKNVNAFIKGIEVVQKPIRGRIGNMLGFGAPGTGKTEVAQWFSAQNDVPYVRAKDITSRRTLLSNIVAELGEAPAYRTEDLFNQIVEHQIEQPRPIIIDEVDYLVRGGAVEVLRDINDMTNTPIIMLGMENADRKLKVFRHLYDRFTITVSFKLFDEAEVGVLAGDICDTSLSDCAVKFIHSMSKGKLRLTTTWFTQAERLARLNNLEKVTASHLRQCLEKR